MLDTRELLVVLAQTPGRLEAVGQHEDGDDTDGNRDKALAQGTATAGQQGRSPRAGSSGPTPGNHQGCPTVERRQADKDTQRAALVSYI